MYQFATWRVTSSFAFHIARTKGRRERPLPPSIPANQCLSPFVKVKIEDDTKKKALTKTTSKKEDKKTAWQTIESSSIMIQEKREEET